MALGDLEISIAPAGSGSTAVVEAVGEVDLGNSDQLAESATAAGAGGGGVVLDMSGVTFMDSSGLKALLLATRDLGAGLAVVVTPGSSVERLIVLAGVADRIPNYASRSEALDALDSTGSRRLLRPPPAPRRARGNIPSPRWTTSRRSSRPPTTRS